MIYALSVFIGILLVVFYLAYKTWDTIYDEIMDEVDDLHHEIIEQQKAFEHEVAILRVNLKEAQGLVSFHMKSTPQLIDVISSDNCGICNGTVFSETRIPEFDINWRTCKKCNYRYVERG